MFSFLFSNFEKGIKKVVHNPQLIYTVIVAALITGSFVFMAERFIGIANDAQERLINVRIGSLQDAFVSFASDNINNSPYLNDRIEEIVSSDETITSFKVVVKKPYIDPSGESMPSSYVVVSSNNLNEVNTIDEQASFYTPLLQVTPPIH